jgi:nitroreductase
MDIDTTLRARRSVRRFKNAPVEDEVLDEILELANAAPSAGNLQAREFIVVRDQEVKFELSKAAYNQDFIATAPVLIAVCGNQARSAAVYGGRGRDFYSIQDADAAVMHILLAAHARELGTCWVGAFDDDEVASILELPMDVRPIALIPLGYPEKMPQATNRMPIEKLVHYDNW